MNKQQTQAIQVEIDNLTNANKKLKVELEDVTTLLNTIRHSLGSQPGETALDVVNRVFALYQERAENAQSEVRKFRDRNEVLGKLVDERSNERDTAWAELKEIREAIQAHPEESTADEVRRVIHQKKQLIKMADDARTDYLDQNDDGETDCVTPFDYYGPRYEGVL